MKKRDSITYIAILAAGILLLILSCSPWVATFAYGSLFMGSVIILFQVAVPIEVLKFYHLNPRDFNIYAHNIDGILDNLFPPYGSKKVRPDYQAIGQELVFFLKTCTFILLPYIFVYGCTLHVISLWQGGIGIHFIPNLPPKLWYEIMVQIFVVALPEEIFYRGFLQSALLKKWPNRTHIYGIPFGCAIILTNIFFALGHFVSNWSFYRLMTFFPGLIFSYLVYKNKSVFSAILFHALCNILALILKTSLLITH